MYVIPKMCNYKKCMIREIIAIIGVLIMVSVQMCSPNWQLLLCIHVHVSDTVCLFVCLQVWSSITLTYHPTL